ncbi:uncharacterized protein LOC144168471 [Haemaphysalis longicornis]
MVCSFDQKKAFDRIAHAFLFETLERAGLGTDFVNLVRALYSEPVSAFVVNGRVSEDIRIERSVRQGCPLSPALYVLAIEPLLQWLARDPEIGRFPLPGDVASDVPLFACSDDLTVAVPDEASLERVLAVMEVYCRASGARLNHSKTKVLCLGGHVRQHR